MIFNLPQQTYLLILRSFTFGVVLGFVYDLLFVAIKPMQKGKSRMLNFCRAMLLFVCDFFFCMLWAVSALLVMYYSNRGFFRAIVFVIMFIGFISFRVSIGRVFSKLLLKIYRFICRVVRKIAGILIIPIKFIKNNP